MHHVIPVRAAYDGCHMDGAWWVSPGCRASQRRRLQCAALLAACMGFCCWLASNACGAQANRQACKPLGGDLPGRFMDLHTMTSQPSHCT